MARTDGLTGLPNRRTFDERLGQQLSHSRRHKEPFALLLADIDHFKSIDDTAGHLVGDQVLVHTASIFAASTRAADVAARYGEKSSLFCCPGPLCRKRRRPASACGPAVESLVVPEYAGRVMISVGVAEWRPNESPEALIARADALLYDAKRAGRNRVRADGHATQTSL